MLICQNFLLIKKECKWTSINISGSNISLNCWFLHIKKCIMQSVILTTGSKMAIKHNTQSGFYYELGLSWLRLALSFLLFFTLLFTKESLLKMMILNQAGMNSFYFFVILTFRFDFNSFPFLYSLEWRIA